MFENVDGRRMTKTNGRWRSANTLKFTNETSVEVCLLLLKTSEDNIISLQSISIGIVALEVKILKMLTDDEG